MDHADPWDEVARLQKQMDVELLKQLSDARPDRSKNPEKTNRVPLEDASEHK